MNEWIDEFVEQCRTCQCGTCLDMGHLLCASVGCVNHHTAPFEAIRQVRDWHTGQARGLERARCIKVLEDLRDRARGFNAEAEGGIVAAIDALTATPVPVASSPVGGEQRVSTQERDWDVAPEVVMSLLSQVYLPAGCDIWWRCQNRNFGVSPRVAWQTHPDLVVAEAERLAGGNFA